MKKLFKIVPIVFVIAVIVSCFTSCTPVESLVLSNTEVALASGNSTVVACTVLPENALIKKVTWSSSNEAVATVSDVGVITAVSIGECVVTAKSGKATATVNVTVKKPVEQVILNSSEIKIREEKTYTIVPTITPMDATFKTVTWTSSDSSVAVVDENGVVTGVKTGTCVITATADGISAVANVTVKNKAPDLKAIYEDMCNSIWADLGSDYSYLSVDTNPYNKDDGDYRYIFTVNDAIEKINEKMGLPSSVYNDMNQTSWSMGKQKATFEDIGIEVTWTYHPDKGLEVTYKLLEN